MKGKPVTFDIPKNTPESRCRGCGAPIYWIETPAHKQMPCNADGMSHFATCPHAGKFRRK